MEVPEASLTRRVYNVTAGSVSPAELADEIRKHVPDFEIVYEVRVLFGFCSSFLLIVCFVVVGWVIGW